MENTNTDVQGMFEKLITGMKKSIFGKFENLNLTTEQRDEILILDTARTILRSMGWYIYSVAYNEDTKEFYLKHEAGKFANQEQINKAISTARRFIDD